MINFKQKEFAEYDAMRSLYVELMRPEYKYLKIDVISPSELIPVLNGNSVVIEKFVISTSFFNKDRYRIYFKIGSKAKMPDKVRFSSRQEYRRLGRAGVTVKGKFNKPSEKFFTSIKTKKNNGGGDNPILSSEAPISVDLGYTVSKLSAETISYDIKNRSLVVEVDSIRDAINLLNVLPFGLNYKLYLVS